MSTIKNSDLTVHDDWYLDGAEGVEPEQLWRMDFAVGPNEYQVQLFAKVDPTQLDEDGDLATKVRVEDERYVEFRLFLERDNRTADGGPRIDYACGAWPLTPGRAEALLSLSEAELPAAIAAEVSHVAGLPCDRRYIDNHCRGCGEAVGKSYRHSLCQPCMEKMRAEAKV